jgi:response regulator RpfG family c-di-GMP phosphodiesterase/serine/threonine protein kinase
VGLLPTGALEQFFQREELKPEQIATGEALGKSLVKAGLLTEYQAHRVLAGSVHGLVLGTYRVLDRIGSGGMSVVFLGEHCLMKRRVAIKVVPMDDDCHPVIRQRFYSEMHVLSGLHHPNIVLAHDAGEVVSPGPNQPTLVYLVMELVSGGDLEQVVLDQGPPPIPQACAWIRQGAAGLQAAHDHHLIHRDIKPSNLLLTDQRTVKVVDFGLARQFCSQLTDPRALLGSVEFMAPEQSYDATTVGAEADIYGLGATLFWLLTGQSPYPMCRSVGASLRALQQDSPRRLRSLLPEAPEELDQLIARMLARDPRQRPTTPLTVMNALVPFINQWDPRDAWMETWPRTSPGPVASTPLPATAISPTASPGIAGSIGIEGLAPRILIVDDEPAVRSYCRTVLQDFTYVCREAGTGEEALASVREQPCDLVLLDLNLPDLDGYEVCRHLREQPPLPHLKIIVVSGRGDQNELAEALPRGADDYVPKPFKPNQLRAKALHALRVKSVQDRVDLLAGQLLLTNQQLEESLRARVADVRQAHDALLFGMAKMAESRDGETAGHLRRLQLYCQVLALQVSKVPPWYGLVDERFLEQLDRCVPLHDIGKIGLPDEVLLKPGRLNQNERALMETHTLIGDGILETMGRTHGASLEFLGMARGIVRSHHERYDGCGYPDRLSGEAIPAAARLVAVADVYDALRRQRRHKSALDHADAAKLILHGSTGQFDPTLLRGFIACQAEFAKIFHSTSE